MDAFERGLEDKFQTQSSDLTESIKSIDPQKVIELDLENKEFLADFNRVIDNNLVPHAKDKKEEIMKYDPYINM